MKQGQPWAGIGGSHARPIPPAPKTRVRCTAGIVALVLCLALPACREEANSATVIVEDIILQDARYSVPRPAGFEATILGQELQLTEAGHLRAPRVITVRPAPGGFTLGALAEQRGDVSYRIAETGAGSGGVVWELMALKSLGDATVQITASYQSEAARSDFVWVWPVIDGIRAHR